MAQKTMADLLSGPRTDLQERFFFQSEGKNLFGNLIRAESPEADTGWLFCDPFAEEKLWSQRILFNLAGRMAEAGFPVLRFDYMGHGDSEGDFSEATLASRTRDILNAAAVLKEKTGLEKIGLFGLRLGGTLALNALREGLAADDLILWAPVLNIRDYLYDCLRANLSTQMVIYRKIRETRDGLVEKMRRGERVNVEGYELPGMLYDEAAELTADRLVPARPGRCFVLDIMKKEKKMSEDLQGFIQALEARGVQAVVARAVFEPFWGELRTYYPSAPELEDRTISYIRDSGGP
jgi:exosortase A-associated hydrolase 2